MPALSSFSKEDAINMVMERFQSACQSYEEDIRQLKDKINHYGDALRLIADYAEKEDDDDADLETIAIDCIAIAKIALCSPETQGDQHED